MLTGKQKRYLRSLAVNMKPVTQIGKDGVTDAVLESLNDAFNNKELIKINLLKTCEDDKNAVAEEITSSIKCELVQIIGKTIVLYKRNKEPKIIF